MLKRRVLHHRDSIGSERGAILVITVIVMSVLLVAAGYAIDTAIWFVHARHLQTEADAAALAGAQDFTCTPGAADSTVDTQISNTVHTYDGTGLATPPVTPYNPQVSVQPTAATTYSPGSHNLFSEINQANYINQSTPNDTAPSGSAWSGSPCQDSAVNVKMTETNLPSFFPFINPSYINKEAQVSIEGLASGDQNLPLAIPSQAATVLHATLIDEGNSDAPLGNGRINLTSSDGSNWSGAVGSVTLDSSRITGPIGLRVDIGGGASCVQQLLCYDSGSSNGITYTRVWSASGVPGYPGTSPAPPVLGDATFSPGSSNPCALTGPPPTPAVLSDFTSSPACNVQLKTTVYFASGATCSNVSLSLALSVNGQSPAIHCNSASNRTTSPCSTTQPCVATTWTSDNVAVGGDSPDGPVTFDVSWNQTYGTVGSHTCATGSSNKCKGDFGVAQRWFNGSTSNSSSRSGPIVSATVTDSSGNAFISHQLDGTSVLLNVNVQISNPGVFTNVSGGSTATTGSPVTLHTGGNQGTFAIECNGSNGNSQFIQYTATGCPQAFTTTTLSNPPVCNTPQTPAICVNQNPGNGKQVEPGIDCRVNGVISYNVDGTYNSCSPTNTCVHPNHWTSPNLVSSILDQQPRDPRLVQVLIVDSSAWVGVTGSNSQTPIRFIATFYITGWSQTASQGADPCNGTTIPTQPGSLPYTADDNPGSTTNVLLGHFVQYVAPGSQGTGNGQPCSTSFGDCIAILTK